MAGNKRIRRSQLIRHAEGYLELGLPEHTLDSLDRLHPEEVDAHAFYLRGEALRTLGRFPEAIQVLEKAAREDSENIHLWLALGWCYKRNGQLELAIYALEQALQADPSEAIIHYNLACYWSLAHNKASALEYLSQAFELDSGYRDLVATEPDFDNLRNDSDFQSLVSVIV